MNLNKTLKVMGIEPIRNLNSFEKNNIIKSFVKSLQNTFPEYNINIDETLNKMFECEMCFAKFPESLGTANYFYKNKTIYFKQDANLEKLDEYMLHELIHYFQDIRDKNGNLSQMGLCYFLEFKMYGMAINEAAVQYIVAKMLNNRKQKIEYSQIKVRTISESYYPLLCSLIMQIVYLIGEKPIINSTLFSTDEFFFTFADIIGENTFKEIQILFDELLEIKQQLIEINEEEKIKEQEKIIKCLYENIQNKILTSYFDRILTLIDTVEEAEMYRNKINGYEKIIGNVDDFKFYEEYKQKMLEKLDSKIIDISRKNSKNMLAVVSNNKLFAIFRFIKNFFRVKKNEYR